MWTDVSFEADNRSCVVNQVGIIVREGLVEFRALEANPTDFREDCRNTGSRYGISALRQTDGHNGCGPSSATWPAR